MRPLRSTQTIRTLHDAPAIWPPDHRSKVEQKEDESLFLGARRLRQFTIMIDADLDRDESLLVNLLMALIGREQFHVWRYADDGPTESQTEWTDWGPRCPGWAILGNALHGRYRELFYTNRRGGQTYTAISEAGIGRFENDRSLLAEDDLDEDIVVRQRGNDYRAMRIAEKLKVDLYITNRPYLVYLGESGTEMVDMLTPSAAIPLVSLFLRSQRMYYIHPRNHWGEARVDKGFFYLLALRAVLPSSWRYNMIGNGLEGFAVDGDRISHLAWSSLQRVERALMVRDELHVTLNRPQGNESADDAVAAFDHISVLLLGAFDAAARFTHLLFAMTGSIRQVSWHRNDWLNQLRGICPDLAELHARPSAMTAAYQVVKLLRNSVHGEHLQTVHLSRHGLADAALISLPSGDTADLLQAMESIAPADKWGVEQLSQQGFHIDPGRLVEGIFPHLLKLLDHTMRIIADKHEVETGKTLLDPPESGIFAQRNLTLIHLQLGLED